MTHLKIFLIEDCFDRRWGSLSRKSAIISSRLSFSSAPPQNHDHRSQKFITKNGWIEKISHTINGYSQLALKPGENKTQNEFQLREECFFFSFDETRRVMNSSWNNVHQKQLFAFKWQQIKTFFSYISWPKRSKIRPKNHKQHSSETYINGWNVDGGNITKWCSQKSEKIRGKWEKLKMLEIEILEV